MIYSFVYTSRMTNATHPRIQGGSMSSLNDLRNVYQAQDFFSECKNDYRRARLEGKTAEEALDEALGSPNPIDLFAIMWASGTYDEAFQSVFEEISGVITQEAEPTQEEINEYLEDEQEIG